MQQQSPTFDCSNLMVNYIPLEVTDAELRQLFEQFGALESAKVVLDKHTGFTKGYGFVRFNRSEDAVKALKELDGFPMYGKRLKVGFARAPSNGAQQSTQQNGPAQNATIAINLPSGAVPMTTMIATPNQPVDMYAGHRVQVASNKSNEQHGLMSQANLLSAPHQVQMINMIPGNPYMNPLAVNSGYAIQPQSYGTAHAELQQMQHQMQQMSLHPFVMQSNVNANGNLNTPPIGNVNGSNAYVMPTQMIYQSGPIQQTLYGGPNVQQRRTSF